VGGAGGGYFFRCRGEDFGGTVSRDFIEVGIFVGILSLAIVYAWRKGVFDWR